MHAAATGYTSGVKRWFLTISGCLVGFSAAADENPLSVQLVSEASRIAPGEVFHVGLHLKHPPGFHSYWKHPGVVGVPTSVEWTLPEGFVAGEIQWPAPEKVMMAIYPAQGYHGETLLIIPVTAAAELESGSVTLEARVSWMCCGKACSPASLVPFNVEIAVGESTEIDPELHALFEKSRAQVPKPDPRWETAARRENDRILFSMKPADGGGLPDGVAAADLRFFTEDGQVETDQAQEIDITADGTIVFSMAIWEFSPENPESLPGVVRATNGVEFTMAVDPAY